MTESKATKPIPVADPAERLLKFLIPWLNEQPSGLRLNRVLEILDLTRKLYEISRYDPVSRRQNRERNQVEDRLWELTERYKARPMVGIGRDGIYADWAVFDGDSSDPDCDEFYAVKALVDAVASGLLSRIAQCVCGKYFLTRSSQGRFCSAECRVEFWEKSPERKEQKRRKARQYYRLHRYKNVK